MTRIALITTGQCERLALGKSLGRVFPDAEFLPPQFAESFTSADLSQAVPITSTPRNVQKLASRIVAAVEVSRGLAAADCGTCAA